MSPLKIIIVGAGIGGPAAALGLVRNGHHVTIYERATNTGEIGYAFRITPNSDRCLKALGIDAQAGGAMAASTNRMFTAEGQIIDEVRENANTEKAKRGASVFAYRPQLHQQLMKAALEGGVHLRSGVKVTSVDTARTAVVLENGDIVSADVIIAADGVHSVARPCIIDSTRFFPRASTGHNAFRFLVSKSLVQNDSIMSPVVNEEFRMFAWRGQGKDILVYPVDYDKQFNVTCTHPEQLSDKEVSEDDPVAAVAYDQKVSLETVLGIYHDFDPVAIRLLKLADPDGFRVWKLLDMDDIPRWSLGHTVLMGDACHPLSPFGFSGASMAIEDAVTLSTLLTSNVKPEEIPGRFELYEEIRKPRVARVREQSRENARGPKDKQTRMGYMEFLSSYDAIEQAKHALSKHLELKSPS